MNKIIKELKELGWLLIDRTESPYQENKYIRYEFAKQIDLKMYQSVKISALEMLIRLKNENGRRSMMSNLLFNYAEISRFREIQNHLQKHIEENEGGSVELQISEDIEFLDGYKYGEEIAIETFLHLNMETVSFLIPGHINYITTSWLDGFMGKMCKLLKLENKEQVIIEYVCRKDVKIINDAFVKN